MRKELANKQIKFKHYIFTPIRILKRAKELLYLKGVRNRSASRPGNYGHAASSVQISSHHLQAKSTNILNNTMPRATGDKRLNELSRTVPIKNAENQTKLFTHLGMETRGANYNIQRQRQRSTMGYKYNRMKMSYRTEVRKMETVDEDKPCYFEEDRSDNSNSNLLYLYPRTRNYGGINRRVMFHQ